jgi:tRNA modification GTPase
MQIAAQRSIDSADVVLWCVAPGEATECSLENAIIVHTMKDKNNSHNNAINAHTGEGLAVLQAKVSDVLINTQTPKLDALALLPRHERSLENTLVALKETLSQIDIPELASASLREALNSIGSITGHVTPDEIIGEVFSTFCIGK